MPSMPRMEVATPTVAAGMPRPPVKRKGRETGEEEGVRGGGEEEGPEVGEGAEVEVEEGCCD